MGTDIVGLAGLAIGILGIFIGAIVSYYFYKRGIRKKEPVYSIRSFNLISDYVSKYQYLSVKYKTNKVERLTVSKLVFFNRGDETISKQDIDTVNHLAVVGDNGSVLLDAKVLQANNASNNFKLDVDSEPHEKNSTGNYLLGFDYVDKNQGAVIEVIHTGLSSKDLVIKGDIIGVSGLVRLPSNSLVQPVSGASLIRRYLRTFLTVLVLLTSVFTFPFVLNRVRTFVSSSTPTPPPSPASAGGVVGLATTVIAIGFLITFGAYFVMIIVLTLRQYLAERANAIPVGLEKFYE